MTKRIIFMKLIILLMKYSEIMALKIIIKKSIKTFLKKTIIKANVKHDNKGSIKIFESLKFHEIKSSSIKKRFELLVNNI